MYSGGPIHNFVDNYGVVKEFDDNLILASRNLQNVVLILADEINVLDVVGTDVMVITEDALKYVEEVLK